MIYTKKDIFFTYYFLLLTIFTVICGGASKIIRVWVQKKNTNWRQYHQAYVDKWDELPPRDPDEEEWNAEGRYRRWFNVYGAASRPLQPYHMVDMLPHVLSAVEIPNVRYIPHLPHRQRTVH
jgi:hypothetical protein